MENASKALLIAGAILIAILLIALGMMAFNAGKSASDNASTSLTSTQVTSFNSQFTQMEGRKTGSEVRSLINTMITNNKNTESLKTDVQFCGADPTTANKSRFSINKYYNVECKFEGTNGLVSDVVVTDATL